MTCEFRPQVSWNPTVLKSINANKHKVGGWVEKQKTLTNQQLCIVFNEFVGGDLKVEWSRPLANPARVVIVRAVARAKLKQEKKKRLDKSEKPERQQTWKSNLPSLGSHRRWR